MTSEVSRNLNSPIVVFGPLRGGTTLIRLMLDEHPSLSVPGESDYLVDYIHATKDGWHYDIDRLTASRIFRDSGLTVPEGKSGEDTLRDMVAQIGRQGGGRPVLMLHRGLSKFLRLMPDAQVVRMLRDPRDVARSSIGMGWAGNLYYGLGPWLETESAWREFETAHPQASRHTVRYEDLVAEPEKNLGEICSFLNIAYDPAMLSYPQRTSYSAPDPSLSYQWKRKLSEREVQLVEARAGKIWDDCGYERSGLPAAKIGVASNNWLRLQNRTAIWRHMSERYGVVDPILRGFGRRLGMRRLERSAAARMSEVDRRHLK